MTFFGFIFYIHNVVGGGVYFKNDIYGGRTSLFLSSQRMPDVTSGDCEIIQLYEYIIVDRITCDIFCFIFYGHRVVGNNIYCTYTKMGGGM